MKTDVHEESGLEELLRLSKEVGNMEKGLVRDRLEYVRKTVEREAKKNILQNVLKAIRISVVLDQLELVATPEIVELFGSLDIDKQGAGELRKLILDLASQLAKDADGMSHSHPDLVSIEQSAKTLAILIKFLFHIE